MPAKLAERAPRVVEKDDGTQVWVYDGEEIPNVGFNAVVGRPVSEYSFEPARFDEMRKGAWDIHERIRDMDLNGIYASLCFPSFLPGFAGQRIQVGRDPELALATVRAWNDWHIDEWAGSYPGRIIPCQLPYLLDPDVAADEVRRNAERGFKAITFSEMPHELGLPSLHSGHWDPLMRACADRHRRQPAHRLVQHVTVDLRRRAARRHRRAVLRLRHVLGRRLAVLPHPGAVPGHPHLPVRGHQVGAALLDRLDHMLRYHEMYGTWSGIELTRPR